MENKCCKIIKKYFNWNNLKSKILHTKNFFECRNLKHIFTKTFKVILLRTTSFLFRGQFPRPRRESFYHVANVVAISRLTSQIGQKFFAHLCGESTIIGKKLGSETTSTSTLKLNSGLSYLPVVTKWLTNVNIDATSEMKSPNLIQLESLFSPRSPATTICSSFGVTLFQRVEMRRRK